MDYARQQRDPARHAVGIVFVVAVHAFVIYALMTGLARQALHMVKKPLDVAVIEEVKLEKIRDEAKPVCYFEGMQKGLVLNKTNSMMIAAIAGTPDTDRWPKTEVTLYPTKVPFEGRIVDSIRVDAKLPKAV